MVAAKRAVVCALAVLVAVVVAGCGGDDGGTGSGSDVRVALVTDIGGLNDRGFNALANEGLERAETELGIEGRVFISRAANDYVPNLSRAAREDLQALAVGQERREQGNRDEEQQQHEAEQAGALAPEADPGAPEGLGAPLPGDLAGGEADGLEGGGHVRTRGSRRP